MVGVTYATHSTERSQASFVLLLHQVQKVQKVVEARLKIWYGWWTKHRNFNTIYPETFLLIGRLEYRTCDQVSSYWGFAWLSYIILVFGLRSFLLSLFIADQIDGSFLGLHNKSGVGCQVPKIECEDHAVRRRESHIVTFEIPTGPGDGIPKEYSINYEITYILCS